MIKICIIDVIKLIFSNLFNSNDKILVEWNYENVHPYLKLNLD